MKNISLFYSLFFVCFLFTACTSLQKGEEKKAEIIAAPVVYKQWEAKALIKNLTTGEANILNLDLISQKKFPIRAEVNTSLGIHLASILISEKDIEILLPKSKKYFHGELSQKALRPVIGVSLDPRLIVAALYDEAYPDWSCQAQDGKISECLTPEGEKIVWFYNKEDSGKRIEIKGENFESQIQVKSLVDPATVKQSTFFIRIPESYKKFILKL